MVKPHTVSKIEIGTERASLHFNEGKPISVRLIAGADGRRSICREAAEIGSKEWAYEQKAIATSFGHASAHENISMELHRKAGSVTTVPLTDPHASSLIWVGTTEEIDALMRLGEASFAAELAQRLGGILGKIDEVGPRASISRRGADRRQHGRRPHRADRRGGACAPADRRARPQSRLPRRGGARRLRQAERERQAAIPAHRNCSTPTRIRGNSMC